VDQSAATRVQAYLKRAFGNPHFAVTMASRGGAAFVQLKGEPVGVITEDEDEEGSFQFEARLEVGAAGLDAAGVARVEQHLKALFGNPQIKVIGRPRQKDSAEVELNGEFIAVVYEDEDEDGSFLFEMAILAEDLAA
jgi:uncharacterized protein YcgL (UPF0745 family)